MAGAIKVLVVSVARGKWERSEIGVFKAGCYATGNPRIGKVMLAEQDKEPTSCARNEVVAQAYAAGMRGDDLICMLDNDNVPNLKFFNTAVNWLMRHPGPACIGSPYRGAPQKESPRF